MLIVALVGLKSDASELDKRNLISEVLRNASEMSLNGEVCTFIFFYDGKVSNRSKILGVIDEKWQNPLMMVSAFEIFEAHFNLEHQLFFQVRRTRFGIAGVNLKSFVINANGARYMIRGEVKLIFTGRESLLNILIHYRRQMFDFGHIGLLAFFLFPSLR